ncbi:MAG: prepilin-type N-terminal cleavage/methylation domain-containing protein [Phycisphaeraceae bacterium]
MKRGMTLIELLLSLAVTGIIGVTVTAMLFGVTQGTASRNDMRNLVVKHQAVLGRVGSAIRTSKTVLGSSSTYLVLWIADSNGDAAPNLAELRWMKRDTATSELKAYKVAFPTSMTQAQKDAANTAYTLNDNFLTVAAALESNTYVVAETWATSVTALAWSLNSGTAQQATLVSFRVTLNCDAGDDMGMGAACLRNNGVSAGSGAGGSTP